MMSSGGFGGGLGGTSSMTGGLGGYGSTSGGSTMGGTSSLGGGYGSTANGLGGIAGGYCQPHYLGRRIWIGRGRHHDGRIRIYRRGILLRIHRRGILLRSWQRVVASDWRIRSYRILRWHRRIVVVVRRIREQQRKLARIRIIRIIVVFKKETRRI